MINKILSLFPFMNENEASHVKECLCENDTVSVSYKFGDDLDSHVIIVYPEDVTNIPGYVQTFSKRNEYLAGVLHKKDFIEGSCINDNDKYSEFIDFLKENELIHILREKVESLPNSDIIYEKFPILKRCDGIIEGIAYTNGTLMLRTSYIPINDVNINDFIKIKTDASFIIGQVKYLSSPSINDTVNAYISFDLNYSCEKILGCIGKEFTFIDVFKIDEL